ncbi:hypothetical protein [Acetivibrio straminisolvens]|jgi:predicted nucleotidyltransferase|uniref:hypothetical protein n=1 Tax=Acetivibrio straminisolvens TaxID=253314 RepID=UPI00223F621C|nr:hypothetical protein [Acetivibrio straminisolvens]
MRSLSLANDRGLKRILDIMEQCSERVDVKLMSIVLYGARAKGDNTSQSVYEFLILSNNDTSLDKFILFISVVH